MPKQGFLGSVNDHTNSFLSSSIRISEWFTMACWSDYGSHRRALQVTAALSELPRGRQLREHEDCSKGSASCLPRMGNVVSRSIQPPHRGSTLVRPVRRHLNQATHRR